MSTYFGSSSSETLDFDNWDYDWDSFYMGAGNDYVNTADPDVAYYFEGGSGRDHFFGYNQNDTAFGGNDVDHLSGYAGDDYLDGGSGNDAIKGMDGDDEIYGGTGRDNLTGGDGSDTFHYARGQSNLKSSQVDVIQDWDVTQDYIYTTAASGSSSNYREAATNAGSIEAARDQAEQTGSLTNKTFVFLYNQHNDRGFLLMDLDGNRQFETGVVLKGAGSASDMNWSDIL